MGNYALGGARPPVLTEHEQRRILQVTGESSRTYRDHCLISLALGTGLREHELAALDRLQVMRDDGRIRRRVVLKVFKGAARRGPRARPDSVVLPDECQRKLARYVRDLPDIGPLFPSREGGGRLSTRQIRTLWQRWQKRAGFERHHPFHVLRHTFCSNFYALTKDPWLTRDVARHSSVNTTSLYVHVGEEELQRAVNLIRC